MAQKPIQGEVSTTGTKIENPKSLSFTAVINFRINNPLAYTFTLKKYEADTDTLITLYSVDLDAGDTLLDEYVLTINGKDYVELISSIAGTYYTMQIVQ
jgi:hypothetical protein